MEKNNKSIYDFDFNLICEYFSGLERQGPGSVEVTRKALSFIDNLPENAEIADLGCGTGGQTLTLAESVSGHITAIDLFPDFIDKLQKKAQQLNYAGRISTHVGSMDNLPFTPGTLDLMWAEGSIYNIGYEQGLKKWLKYLKPDAYVAVSEVSWFTEKRPDEIETFWAENYAGIDTIPTKIKQMEKAGYRAVAHFILPENCWIENFYAFAPPAMDAFLKRHNYSDNAVQFIEREKREIALYNKYKDYYGYVFYIGQKIK